MLEILVSSIDFSSNLFARILLTSSIMTLSSMAFFFCLVTLHSSIACDSYSNLRFLISLACSLFFSIRSIISTSNSLELPCTNNFVVSLSLYCVSFFVMVIYFLLFKELFQASMASFIWCSIRCISISQFSMVFPNLYTSILRSLL